MIYQDEYIYLEFENSEIPWVKIFSQHQFKELSDCDLNTRNRLFEAAFAVEEAMREFYNPQKINWASFANYLPRVHIHIQARFEDDSFFPQSMWGTKQRNGAKRELMLDTFSKILQKKLGTK